MKPQHKSLKLIALLLSVMVIVQGCVIYNSKSITLKEAAETDRRVKVHTTLKKTVKFKRIIAENEQYYGIKKKKGDIVKYHLERAELNRIRTENETLSRLATFFGIIFGLYGTLFIAWGVNGFSY